MSLSWVVVVLVGVLAALALGPTPIRAWLTHHRARVLVIAEFEPHLDLLVATLRRAGYRPRGCHPRGAIDLLRRGAYPIVVSGLMMPYLSGSELLAATRALSPCPQVVLLTGDPAGDAAGEAIRRGACAVVDKRSMGDLRRAAHGAFARAFGARRASRAPVPVPVRVR